MTDKELKKLNRSELIQLLLDVTEENEALRAEIEHLNAELEDRKILIGNAGSIAEASMALNEIFERAQNAADIYVENVMRMSMKKSANDAANAEANAANRAESNENVSTEADADVV